MADREGQTVADHGSADGNIPEQGTGKALKRRGILAAAGAAVAGLAAKHAALPVGATHQPEDLGLGLPNTSTLPTRLQYFGGVLGSAILIVGDGGFEPGISHPAALAGYAVRYPSATPNVDVGVFGSTSSSAAVSAGVVGQHLFTGTGVYGEAIGSGTGVHGVAAAGGNGVTGTASGTGNGVYSTCYGTTTSYGVWGLTDAGKGVVGGATTGTGVYGASEATGASNGNGVYGYVAHVGSTQVTAGVFGDSTASYGVIGRTTAVGYSGITGITTTPGAAAFAGASTVAGAYAAYFVGSVVVQGDFAVVGGAKNAAVKDASGQHRLVYCVESPEAWFEDFGKGQLVNGKADVKLDLVFTQIAHTDEYHVFLTDYGNCGHLSVPSRSAGGFTVQAEKAGASGTFSYRVVAKRSDIKAERLAKFDLPKIKIPKPTEMPPPPEPPKATPSPLPPAKP